MDIVVVGTSEYFWALRIFARQFNSCFGNDAIVHYGDIECDGLPKNFTSRRVPCYSQGSWPWEHWYGNGLISILERLTEDLVMLFLPDHWFASVDKGGIRELARYMSQNPDVMRGNLIAGTCLDGYGESVGNGIVQVHPNNPHCGLFGGCAGSPALWNRKNLLEILEPGWSLWGVEKLGTEKMAKMWPKWRSVGIKPGPIIRAHGLSHSNPGVASFQGMSQEDAEACAKMLPGGWTWTA